MTLNSKDLEIIRARYIKKYIIKEIWKKWYTQEQVSDMTKININTLKQYIWWPRAKTDDEYYDIIFSKVLWFSEEKIEKIKAEARMAQIEAEFWDNFFEIIDLEKWDIDAISTVDEAQKVLFKLSWIANPTEDDLKLVNLAIEMAKTKRNNNK